MTLEDFRKSLEESQPPQVLPVLLKALWHDARGNWDEAHRLAQDVNTEDGSWVHAYLHREEGDLGNASYWYTMAKRKMPSLSLQEEWQNMVRAFLGKMK